MIEFRFRRSELFVILTSMLCNGILTGFVLAGTSTLSKVVPYIGGITIVVLYLTLRKRYRVNKRLWS